MDKTRAVGIRKKGDVSELIIEDVAVERVNEYNYLGTVCGSMWECVGVCGSMWECV